MTVGASCLDAVMTSVIAKLLADASFVAACSGGVYDAVPTDVEYPYGWVTLREDPSSIETFGKLGFEVIGLVQIYDRDDTRETTQRIDQVLGHLARVFHHTHASLSITGWRCNHSGYDGARPMPNVIEAATGRIVRSKIGQVRFLVEAA